MKDSNARVLRFLRLRGDDGASEAEIQKATAIASGAQRVHELRNLHGFDIQKVMERSPIGARYARWYLRETPTAPVPMTGTQQEMSW